MKIGICPGSFDPVTLGHMDIIARARKIFDHVIVAVLVNPTKHTAFTLEERIELLKRCTAGMSDVEVVGFDGLLADYARVRGATALVATMPVPASPSGGHIGMPGRSVPVGSSSSALSRCSS